ncbi:MAG: L-2-hydroxyglutarate dehydrogenase [Chlamydiae bacterium]|nr:L-2-hydroxyglutarate dehydrogenase [Chlamydiota bacterium]
MKQYDLIVTGGGIIGLATAYNTLKDHPHFKVAILEKESSIAQHQTGHNSGVIHSGIYYKPGSLKAKNCVLGVQKLLEFCNAHDISYDLCGKLIVATSQEELPRLKELFRRGQANQVTGLKMLNAQEIKKLEPYAAGIEAIHAPNTGIVDYKKVAQTLYQEILRLGGDVFFNQEVTGVKDESQGVLVFSKEKEFSTKFLINCCGLYADSVARKTGSSLKDKIIPFRGEYYYLKPSKAHLLKGLIYPVPNPKFPFLGVHLTKRISGEVEVGPNAVLAFAKEGYKKSDINIKEMGHYLKYSGFWSMVKRHWKVGFYEFYRSYFKSAFLKDIQRLMPDIKEQDLVPGGSGVRAQVVSPNGQMVDDFLIHSSSKVVNVLNAPSPGATSCLAIGAELKNRLNSKIKTIDGIQV